MKSVFCVRTVIDPIEEIQCCASIIQDRELRSVEEAARTFKVEGYEVSSFGIAPGERAVLMRGAKRSVKGVETAGGLFLIETGARSGVNDQTCLVAILRRCGARDYFHGFDYFLWDLPPKETHYF